MKLNFKFKHIFDLLILSLVIFNFSCGLEYTNTLDNPCTSDFRNEFSFCSYVAVGALDTSFGTNGAYVGDGLAGGTDDDVAYDIHVLSNDKMLVAGYSKNGSGDFDIFVLRLNKDGDIDTTFGTDGVYSYDSGNDDRGYAVNVQSDGKIIVAGYVNDGNRELAVIRLDEDGTIDTSFGGGDGIYQTAGSVATVGYDIEINSDDTILIGGYQYNATTLNNATVWKLEADGSALVGGFATAGLYTGNDLADDQASNVNDKCTAIALQSDGKIIVSSQSNNGSNDDLAVVRLDTDGSVDTSFASSGYYALDDIAGGSGHDRVQDITVDGSDDIYLTGFSAGSVTNDLFLVKLTSAGAAHTDFSDDGIVTFPHPSGGDRQTGGYGIIVHGGKPVISGIYDTDSTAAETWDMLVLRYTASGELDDTFADGGIFTHDNAAGGATSANDWGHAVKVNSVGRYLISGYSVNSTDNDDEAVVWRIK